MDALCLNLSNQFPIFPNRLAMSQQSKWLKYYSLIQFFFHLYKYVQTIDSFNQS